MPDVPVDEVALADAKRLEETGNRGRGGDGLGHRRIGERPDAEHHALRAIQVHGGDEQGPQAGVKVVGDPAGDEGAPQVFLQLPHREEACRHVGPAAGEDVGPVQAEIGGEVLPHRPHQTEEAAAGVGDRPALVDRSAVEVERVVAALVEDVIEVERPDAVGHQRRHHRSRARSHVQVEVIGAKARQGLVQGGQRADLVHAADDAASGEDERALGRTRPPAETREELAQGAHARHSRSKATSRVGGSLRMRRRSFTGRRRRDAARVGGPP